MNLRALLYSIFLIQLSACSSLDFINSPSAKYRSFVDKRLKKEKIFDRGREVVSVDLMRGDQELKNEQEKITPGFSIEVPVDQDVIVAAVDISSWGRFSQENVKFSKQGLAATKVVEVINNNIIASHYPYAYPQERVFYVYFPKSQYPSGKEKVKLNTLYGEINLDL